MIAVVNLNREQKSPHAKITSNDREHQKVKTRNWRETKITNHK